MDTDIYVIEPHGQNFAVYETLSPLTSEEALSGPTKTLVAICTYKKGATEVKRRLEGRVKVRKKVIVCRDCRKELDHQGEDD